MKFELLDLIRCLQCGGGYTRQAGTLVCQVCDATIPLAEDIPIFTAIPEGLQPSEKLARGPKVGTPWRQANWRFLETHLQKLPAGALILDIGAGRGDFADLTSQRLTIAIDIYPYPEVDVVCDLTQVNPFRSARFDAVLLMNVLEHIYDTHQMLREITGLLKPGGILIVTIPFMVKLHQTPVDFVRYSQYALERLGQEHGLQVERMEGYYDPIFFLGEGLGNLKYGFLPKLEGVKRYFGRAALGGIQALAAVLNRLVGSGQVQEIEMPASTQVAKSLAPTGYQVVYRKNIPG